MLKQVGLIGLGNMGRGMALTLKRNGFEVVGTDVAPATRESLAKEGVSVRETIGEVVFECDVVRDSC